MTGPSRGFGDRLRAEREKVGITVYALAKRAGLTKQAVARLESGRSQPTWETVQRLVKALGVSCEAMADPAIGVADDRPAAGRGRPRKPPTVAPTADAPPTPPERPQGRRRGRTTHDRPAPGRR